MSARLRSPRRRADTFPKVQVMTLRRRLTPYAFLAPALILLGVFVFYPIAAVIYYSLTDYDIVTPPVFVGLQNYGGVSVWFKNIRIKPLTDRKPKYTGKEKMQDVLQPVAKDDKK